MLLYHGSNLIVDKPQLLPQTCGLDFGPGFYLTTSEEQAKRFSEIVFNRKKNGLAIVNVFNFDIEEAVEKKLATLKFDNADIEWLRFVTENRLKTYKGTEYDIVKGPVANDTVMPTIQLFLNGFLSEEAAIITLKASKLADQICIKTEKALSLLDFVKSYETGKGCP